MRMLDGRIEERGTEVSRRIGTAMREDRKDAGFTIRELAEKMNISPTHLTRIESGERLMDSIESLILFCEACHVPIDKYLVLCGLNNLEMDTPIRRAFPAVKSTQQEKAISTFARLITSKDLSEENILQILNTAIAFADFCDKQNQEKKAQQEE